MTAIITFIGWHDSGKTTLATQVVARLKAFGYTVGVIKSSSETGVRFDAPGTDTDKHRKAGADAILFVAPDQMVLQAPNSGLSLNSLARRYFPDADIVIGEGFKGALRVPKIEVVQHEDRMLRDTVKGVIAVATDLDIAGNCVFRLNQADEIAAFIRDRFLLGGTKPAERVCLRVNGKRIPLKEFVQNALAGTVAGFTQSLKFAEDATEIELKITLDRPAAHKDH